MKGDGEREHAHLSPGCCFVLRLSKLCVTLSLVPSLQSKRQLRIQLYTDPSLLLLISLSSFGFDEQEKHQNQWEQSWEQE